MSKKPLLNESTVRQFMKFANLGGLTDDFINEAYHMEEDEMEEGAHEMEEALPALALAPAAMGAGKAAALGGAAGYMAGKGLKKEEELE